MRGVFKSRPLVLLFSANFVSMIGSGMNTAAVTWYLLQTTHSEELLGILVVAQAIPSLLLMPFSGVVIDREDRRRLVMLLDAGRGLLILLVAILCLRGVVQIWQLFAMGILVSTGFWMFWPTITALLQELTPEAQFAESNAMLLSGFQAGWLVAGSIVGFVYAKIGIGGILLFDASTYAFSFACYRGVRKGRHTVTHTSVHIDKHPLARFWHEMQDGFHFVRQNVSLALIGATWSLFVAAMMVSGVLTAPLSDRILHAGAIGYGWLNAGWGIGAFISTFYAAKLSRAFGWGRVVPLSMLILTMCFFVVPHSTMVGIGAGIYLASSIYFIAGTARGVGGIALSTSMMELVPKELMGRVQTLFSIFAIALQVSLAPVAGRIAQRHSLAGALALIGMLYFMATLTSFWGARTSGAVHSAAAAASAE
jgi:MFS transporter, DHA3 family, macrolide efflux protein